MSPIRSAHRPGLCCTLLFVSVLLAGACAPLRDPMRSAEPDPARADPYWNDIARYLAGRPLSADSRLLPATMDSGYARHRARMDSFRADIAAEHARLSAWRAREVGATGGERPVLYLFSGADFANVYTIYPDAPLYVLAALEDPGDVRDPLSLSAADRTAALDQLFRALANMAQRNYLLTNVMRTELARPDIRGLLPLFLILQSGLDLEIGAVRQVTLQADGGLAPAAAAEFLEAEALERELRELRARPAGIEITFRAANSTNWQRLLYLRTWIDDNLLTTGRGERELLAGLGEFRIMLKSASYFLHRPTSEGLCDFLTDRAVLVVQDDSGIPFRRYSPARWQVRLYGRYTRAVQLRDQPFSPSQPDLAAAYAATQTDALDFDYGYGSLRGRGRSNMQVAKRRDAAP